MEQSSHSSDSALVIRNEIRPGDIGEIISLHGLQFNKEYGFGIGFEAMIAQSVSDFYLTMQPGRDQLWIIESQHHVVGVTGVVGKSDAKAQIRWVLVHPGFRGCGLGRKLLENALRFCENAGFETVFLHTFKMFKEAANLYKSLGFILTEEKEVCYWGQPLSEQCYELKLRLAGT
ncbi:MAG TPA: GNAT family N-acetyltransferase [Bacillota bacterium]|nr:GNAT family N-acetyltransferase [Bacillota bacterium]